MTVETASERFSYAFEYPRHGFLSDEGYGKSDHPSDHSRSCVFLVLALISFINRIYDSDQFLIGQLLHLHKYVAILCPPVYPHCL